MLIFTLPLTEATLINCPTGWISVNDIPKAYRSFMHFEDGGYPEDERQKLLTALMSTNWNKSEAAKKLHWSRMMLYRKLAKYHIAQP